MDRIEQATFQDHYFPIRAVKEFGFDTSPLHDGVFNIGTWVSQVAKFAKTNACRGYPNGKIRGDAFEHLVECIIRYRVGDKKIDCSVIRTMREAKAGLDMIGKTIGGRNYIHSHQCKFRESRKSKLSAVNDELRVFLDAGVRYDIRVRTIWTTAKGLGPQAKDIIGEAARTFGYDQLCEFVDGDREFWNFYAKCFGAAREPIIGRIHRKRGEEGYIEPHDYQEDALKRYKREVTNGGNVMGRYVFPTGGGKTLIQCMILDERMRQADQVGVHIVAAPRIALLNQLMHAYRENLGDGNYLDIGFHSDTEKRDRSRIGRRSRNTTEIEEVKYQIERSKQRGRHFVVFSTYQSLRKLVDSNISFETLIADESQYCISKNFFEDVRGINAKARLFFTATERYGVGEHSNSNKKVFGKILGEQAISSLINRGILTTPILHVLVGESDDPTLDTLVDEARYIALEQRRLVDDRLHSKTLFACKSVNDIRTIADPENLKKLQSNVPDHAVFTIVSDPRYSSMVNGNRINRSDFLNMIEEYNGNAMIFHYDVMTEGIDIDGITGVAILRKLGHAKLLQTIGRCLRPYKANPSLKPRSYISYPMIDGRVGERERLRDLLLNMREGGIGINRDSVTVKVIGNPKKDDPTKEIKQDFMTHAEEKENAKDDNEPIFEVFRQTMLKDVGHIFDDEFIDEEETRKRIARIERNVKNGVIGIVEEVDADLRREHHEAMLRQEITRELLYDLFAGVYRSDSRDDSSLPKRKKLSPNLASYDSKYRIVEMAWNTGRMKDSMNDEKGRPYRPLTPLALIKEHITKVGSLDGKSVLTFNSEYVPYLRKMGAVVTLTTTEFCESTRHLAESQALEARYLTVEKAMAEAKNKKKFDVVIGNPPYQGLSQLHQKFFNMAVDMTVEGGKVAFVQPAIVYFNKKRKTDLPSQKMRDNIKKYRTEVKMIHPSVFKGALNFNDISMTILTKRPDASHIRVVEYVSGKKYKEVELENVTQTEMEPEIYAGIRIKYEDYVKDNGSLLDILTKEEGDMKARVMKVRGHAGDNDWYTFASNDKKKRDYGSNFGIAAKNKKEANRIFDYLMTNPARFGLALLKFSGNMTGGALGLVPLVDFSRTWTDEEVYELLGLTLAERRAIDNFLPDYHMRQKE